MSAPPRCPWADGSPALRDYHDHEWGVPLHEDRRLFEFLCLEGAQAGLSWRTVLDKRAHYRRVFHDFDIAWCAQLDAAHIERLLCDPGLIRHRGKLAAIAGNARAASLPRWRISPGSRSSCSMCAASSCAHQAMSKSWNTRR